MKSADVHDVSYAGQYLFLPFKFLFFGGGRGGAQNSGRTVASGWNDLGDCLNSSLYLSSVDEHC